MEISGWPHLARHYRPGNHSNRHSQSPMKLISTRPDISSSHQAKVYNLVLGPGRRLEFCRYWRELVAREARVEATVSLHPTFNFELPIFFSTNVSRSFKHYVSDEPNKARKRWDGGDNPSGLPQHRRSLKTMVSEYFLSIVVAVSENVYEATIRCIWARSFFSELDSSIKR